MPKGIKTCVLDFDGVILESVDVKTDAFKELFSRYTDKVEPIVKYHLANNGVSRFTKFRYIWENFLGRSYDENTEKMLGAEFHKIVFDKVLNCPFVAGAEEFLKTMSKKVHLYVASASPSGELRDIIRARGLDGYFTGIYGTPHKKTDVIKEAMIREKALPAETLYVGDSLEDWRAADSAGVLFIGRRNREDLQGLGVPLYDDLNGVNELLSRDADAGLFKELYIKHYLRFINDLAVRYNSMMWFSSLTASKDMDVSRLFIDLFDFVSNPEGLRRKSRPVFPFLRFFAISSFRILRTWYRCVAAHLFLNPGFRKFKMERARRPVYVLRTWAFPDSVDRDGNFNDRFFGNLAEYLKKKDKEVLLIAGAFSRRYLAVASNIGRAKNVIVIPQEYFISWLDPFRALADILFRRVKIKDKLIFMGRDVTDIVQSHLNKDFSDNAFEQIMHFYITKRLLAGVNVQKFIFIYDNNPWEKMILLAIKKYSPGTTTVAYQHTIVSLRRFSLMLGRDEERIMPLPDKLVTNGTVTKKILKRYCNFPEERLAVGCALRFNANRRLLERNRKAKAPIKTILVVLVAAINQSSKLFNLAYDTFKEMKDYSIIIRPHPGLPLNEIRKHLSVSPEMLPSNFRISAGGTAEDDLMRSDILIYDESSVSLLALIIGMPLIYVNTHTIANLDPLFELSYLKREAKDAAGILAAIEYFSKMSGTEMAGQQVLAREYVDSYLKDVSEEGMREFI